MIFVYQRRPSFLQTHRLEKALESGQGMLHDDRREARRASGKLEGIGNGQ